MEESSTIDQHPRWDLSPHYRVEPRRLGKGGQADVFEGVDRRTRERVAVKLLRRSVASATTVDRFRQEYRLSERCGCVPRAREYFELSDDSAGETDVPEKYHSAIVFDFVEGTTLQQLAGHSWTELKVLKLGIQLGEKLQRIHGADIVHRDISPRNLMLDRKGDLHVIDFGISRDLQNEHTLSPPNTGLGTRDYMAPECLVDAASADARADIWSAGSVLLKLLHDCHISRGTSEIIAICRARDPAQRYPTAGMLTQALRARVRRRNVSRWAVGITVAGLLTVCGYGIYAGIASNDAETPPQNLTSVPDNHGSGPEGEIPVAVEDDQWLRYLAAFREMRSGNHDAARAAFQKLQSEESALGDLGLGWHAIYQGHYVAAIPHLERANAQKLTGRAKWNVYMGLVKSHLRSGHQRDFEEYAEQMLTFEAITAKDHSAHAEVYLMLNRTADAIAAAQRSVAIDPSRRIYFQQRFPDLDLADD